MSSLRLPRFQRSPNIAPLLLTERDRALIRCVFEYRFLRSTHLLSLTPGSPQQVLRRLQQLYHHGYLDRPRAQIDYYRYGSQPMVYGLGNRGMELLEHEDGISHRKLDWTARNRSITRYFMEHTLAVAEAMVAIEVSCKRHGVEFIHPESQTLKWSVNIRHDGTTTAMGVAPDRIFGLKNRNETRWFFLEADRATMPVERNNLQQTSFSRKLLAYYETWRQRILTDSFARFQVLTVTTTPTHAESLLSASCRITGGKGSGLFLFTDRRTFASAKDVFQLALSNGRRESVRLVSSFS
jgi:hypothetical protein